MRHFVGQSWCIQKTFRRCMSSSPSHVGKLKERGVIKMIFPEKCSRDFLEYWKKPGAVYCGFDPTASSLHVGNLLCIVGMIHCQRAGHTPVCLVGGATALIGDPTGRTKDREPMDPNVVRQNSQSIAESLHRIFAHHEKYFWTHKTQLPPVKVVNNMDWYKKIDIVTFLSQTGRKFRMQQLLSRQSVDLRLKSEEGMSFTEFTYQIFQAYDWLHLLNTEGCRVQLGGHDQMGNITSGYEMISSYKSSQQVFGLTLPLVTTASGEKLGKTAGNAVWLNSDQTSAYQLYQYFLNLRDNEVEQYLKLFTFLSDDALNAIIRKHLDQLGKRHGQKVLADYLVTLIHGEEELRSAKLVTGLIFSRDIKLLQSLTDADIKNITKEIEHCQITHDNQTVLDIFMQAQLFDRQVDADRVIRQGGVYINYERVQNPDMMLEDGKHILPQGISLLQIGKKSFKLVQWIYEDLI